MSARCSAILFLALALACGEDESSASEPSLAVLDPPPARLSEVSGAVTIAGASARRGSDVGAERALEVPQNGRAVLLLEHGGRVALEGGARARVVEEGAAQLLLTNGSAHALQPPAGDSPRPPLRLVTPTATIDIEGDGEVFVAATDGSSFVGVLRGAATISNGEVDARRRLRTIDLAAGQALAVSARIGEPTVCPRNLRQARAAARAAIVPATEPEHERLAREVTHEAERLDESLRWLEQETRRGRELTNEHRSAVRDGHGEEAERLLRELSDHSQALHRLRQIATARWERLRAQWLRLSDIAAVPANDPVAQRRERVVGLLGL